MKRTATIALLTITTKVVAAAIVVVLNYNTLRDMHMSATTTSTKTTSSPVMDIITEAVVNEMVLVVTDNNGQTFDRYSVYFKDGSVLGLSSNPTSPQGFSQWSEYDTRYISDIHTNEVSETPLAFNEFELKSHVISRVREAYKDYVEFCKQSNATNDEIRRSILTEYKRKSTKH